MFCLRDHLFGVSYGRTVPRYLLPTYLPRRVPTYLPSFLECVSCGAHLSTSVNVEGGWVVVELCSRRADPAGRRKLAVGRSVCALAGSRGVA